MAKDSAPKSLRDAGKEPVAGQWYQLLSDHGTGVGMLQAVYPHPGGERTRMVQVIAIPEPGTPGTGYVEVASPIVRWFQHTPQGIAVHHLQVPHGVFVEKFGLGVEPAEVAELAFQQLGDGEDR